MNPIRDEGYEYFSILQCAFFLSEFAMYDEYKFTRTQLATVFLCSYSQNV